MGDPTAPSPTGPPIPADRLAYTFETHQHACPALCPVRGRLSGAALGYAPSLHGLRWAIPIVRPLPRYYERIRLLVRVDGGITAVPSPPHPVSAGCGRDLPGPVQKASRHAQGLRPRGIVCELAINARSRVAFRLSVRRRHPGVLISRLNGWPAGLPCQRLELRLTA